jgi:hypothetical protein
MKTFSHDKKRLVIALFLAIGFLVSSSYAIAMPLQMDECNSQTVCEKCCLISTPELSGLQYEYSFFACPHVALTSIADPIPLAFDHPPQ